MANNITILDSTATTQSMRTTETGGIHFPHHIVESGSISISNFPVTQPISIASVTIGNSVTIAGTVTASISNFPATQAISIASVTIGNSVTIGSLPAISGTVTANLGTLQVKNPSNVITSGYFRLADDSSLSVSGMGDDNAVLSQISSVFGLNLSQATGSLPISGTVTANTFAIQGIAVTTSNFTSTTPSTVLASFNAGRKVLTIFNEGAGNLHVCAGATCTTIAYQVRLSAGDYYEVPNHQTSLTHSAVFAAAGTARVTQIS
jgi:hypothetical protein